MPTRPTAGPARVQRYRGFTSLGFRHETMLTRDSKTVAGVLDRPFRLHVIPHLDPDRGLLWLSPERLRTGKQAGRQRRPRPRLQRQLRGLFPSTPTIDFKSHFVERLFGGPCKPAS